MKQLYIIGGTMGIGKTTVCRILQQRLSNCVFLDGDWCWDMHPFRVTEETKSMVTENICFLLQNFIRCTAYQNIVFCWVLHEQSIIDGILSRLNTEDCAVHVFSLVAEEKELRRRLEKDVAAGKRSADIIERSVQRLLLYKTLHTQQIDVSGLSPAQTADQIIQN